ncbi:cell wall-binding protein [Methylobacter sp. S3L5C]|uniref:cell wall-binding protein n=1 Tax=Methylobacter sp. S3L5C TaxID=2839024 RepID=UPI001FACABFD|nr:cell wall-binding protein [Methylobacter sp. S3L5C]UOA08568.1 cell wall-binding protein [Methylobacter sp. S3L5C]
MTQNKPPVLAIVGKAKKPAIKTGGGGTGSGSGASKVEKFGDYSVKHGAFHQVKAVRAGGDGDGFVEFALCNFTCKIIEEINQDDGLADSTFLRVEGRRNDGLSLPVVDVPAKSFYSSLGNWPNEHWGTTPFIFPGPSKKDNLRAAIHLYSNINGDIPRRTVYRFTGWKKINDVWHYLTGSGAITAAGLIGGIEVDLGNGHMSRYQLPAPLAGDELKTAVASALAFLTICPNKPFVGVVMLAAVARAPLGECQPTDFAIWLHGLTGSRKSAVAAIAQAFFGNFTARNFPSNWSDSVNDCEMKSHQVKDGIFTVDDFKPSVSPAEASKLHAMAERLIRNTGNQAGRGRRDSNMMAKAAPYNRSMMLITAEDLPRGQSLLGRLLILELSRADVDNTVLTQLQQAAKDGLFMGLMSAYLQWLAPRLDQFKTDFPKMVEQYRNVAIRNGIATSHPRAPEIYANLAAAAETFTYFLQDINAMNVDETSVLLGDVESHLQQAFSEQGAYQNEQDESERFLQLLRAAFSSGNAHIAGHLKQDPPESHPFAWGWRDMGKNLMGDSTYGPMGDCVGWYREASGNDAAEVWLTQDTVFKIVQQFARSQGDAFLISPSSLWRRLLEKGHILKPEKDLKTGKSRTTIQRTVAGVSKRVMILSAALIESEA